MGYLGFIEQMSVNRMYGWCAGEHMTDSPQEAAWGQNQAQMNLIELGFYNAMRNHQSFLTWDMRGEKMCVKKKAS